MATVFYLRDVSGTAEDAEKDWCMVMKHSTNGGVTDEIAGPDTASNGWKVCERQAKKMAKMYNLTAEYTVMPNDAQYTLPSRDKEVRACWLVQ